MRDSPIINLSFLMETGHPNCEAKIGEKSFHKDDLYDLNTQQYNCRIDEDRKIDQLSEKKNRQLYTLEENHVLPLFLMRIFYFCHSVQVLKIRPLQSLTRKNLIMI